MTGEGFQSSTGMVTPLDAPETTASSHRGASNTGNGNLIKALLAVQKEASNVVADQLNTYHNSKYANLAQVRDMLYPIFQKNGIVVTHVPDIEYSQFGIVYYLRMLVLHTSGEFMEGRWILPQIDSDQKIGASITYARRYTLSALAGIAVEEDDDGNSTAKDSTKAKVGAAGQPAVGGIEL
jgi:hypothetical protein